MPDTASPKLLVDARLGWGSGIGRYIENVIPRVASLLPEIAFDVLVTDAHAERAKVCFAQAGNIRIVHTSVQPFSAAEQVRLARYANGCALTWFTNYWIPLAWQGRFTVTVYDVLHLLPDLFPASLPKRWASRCAFAKVCRQAEAAFFISRFTRDEFHRTVGRPGYGIVTQLGADHLLPDRALPAKEKRLLVVAAFKKHKNFATVLNAWKQARVAEHWRLTIVAPGVDLRSSVNVDAMTAGMRGVEMRRGVSDAELRDLYARTAIMLAPSLYEGFGLPLLEAFATGAYAVSSTAGSLVEIAEGADAALVNGLDVEGWVAAIERACTQLDDGRIDAQAVARHNMAHAATFRWDDTARTTANTLRALLDPTTLQPTGRHSDHV
jgi:glycosyltransferase involved in cell wall biosynthesis